MIIGDGSGHGVDVTYEFGQVGIGQDLIDRRGNCGNLSSAVGPFAVDEGLVTPTEPVTTVRFLNTNTNKVIVAHVPTRDGRFDPVGDFELPGVPGTGSRLQLDYLDPSGAVTGQLLPSGNVVDNLDVAGVGTIQVSLVDAANPLVFVRWEDIGLTGSSTCGTSTRTSSCEPGSKRSVRTPRSSPASPTRSRTPRSAFRPCRSSRSWAHRVTT